VKKPVFRLTQSKYIYKVSICKKAGSGGIFLRLPLPNLFLVSGIEKNLENEHKSVLIKNLSLSQSDGINVHRINKILKMSLRAPGGSVAIF